jgi:hypothetical protein
LAEFNSESLDSSVAVPVVLLLHRKLYSLFSHDLLTGASSHDPLAHFLWKISFHNFFNMNANAESESESATVAALVFAKL